jgi:hypothetical protein
MHIVAGTGEEPHFANQVSKKFFVFMTYVARRENDELTPDEVVYKDVNP